MDELRQQGRIRSRDEKIRKLEAAAKSAEDRERTFREQLRELRGEKAKLERRKAELGEEIRGMQGKLAELGAIVRAFTSVAEKNKEFADAVELEFGVPRTEPFVSVRVATSGQLLHFRTGMESVPVPEGMDLSAQTWAEEVKREERVVELRFRHVEGGELVATCTIAALGGATPMDVLLVPSDEEGCGARRWHACQVLRVELLPLARPAPVPALVPPPEPSHEAAEMGDGV
jgi:hypothetical protein